MSSYVGSSLMTIISFARAAQMDKVQKLWVETEKPVVNGNILLFFSSAAPHCAALTDLTSL